MQLMAPIEERHTADGKLEHATRRKTVSQVNAGQQP